MTRRKPKTYCDDWSCPSLWGCERAWARAEEYWNFDQDDFDLGRVVNRKFDRRKDVDSCDDYERATPKPWLAGVFTSHVPMPPPMRGFQLYGIEGGRV